MEIRRIRPDEALPWALLLDADPSRAMVERYLATSEVYLLERVPAAVVGVLVLTPIADEADDDAGAAGNVYEIKNVAVAESEQGRGYGRALIEFAIAEVRARGAVRLYIGTGNSSLSQLGLYQRCGFRIVAVDIDFFTRNYPERLYENDIECRDMLRLVIDFT